MNLSWQETEILQQLSKGAASAPRVNSFDALSAHWRLLRSSDRELTEVLEGLELEGFIEISDSGNILIADKGNAALASL